MRLLRSDNLQLELFTDESKTPKYAILSHTWLQPGQGEEVLFSHMSDLAEARKKTGWIKLEFATKQAIRNGLDYVWIDTCCIDKNSSSELSESINSMYRWYQNSQECYVYLDDLRSDEHGGARDEDEAAIEQDSSKLVTTSGSHTMAGLGTIQASTDTLPSICVTSITDSGEEAPLQRSGLAESLLAAGDSIELDVIRPVAKQSGVSHLVPDGFTECRWFTRGWTLQEMIASPRVGFFDGNGSHIGDLHEFAEPIALTTGVHPDLLRRQRPLASFSISQKMNWASRRVTTRLEDRAYSLLGIFDISLAVIYGEGGRAFQRLQEELLRVYSDHTIFTWGYRPRLSGARVNATPKSLLATSPDDFQEDCCREIVSAKWNRSQKENEILGRCISFDLPVFEASKTSDLGSSAVLTAVLNCCFEDEPTKIVVISLRCGPAGHFMRMGLGYCDIYDAALRCSLRTLTILRHPDEAIAGSKDIMTKQEDYKHQRFMFRCKHDEAESATLAILKVEAYIISNPERPDVSESQRLSDDVWDWKSGCLVVRRKETIDFDGDYDQPPILLEAKVVLTSEHTSIPVEATVSIYPEHMGEEKWSFTQDSAVQVKYQRHSTSTHFRQPPLARLFDVIFARNLRPVTTRVMIPPLLEGRFCIIEFRVKSGVRLLDSFGATFWEMRAASAAVYLSLAGGIMGMALSMDLTDSGVKQRAIAIYCVFGMMLVFVTCVLIFGRRRSHYLS